MLSYCIELIPSFLKRMSQNKQTPSHKNIFPPNSPPSPILQPPPFPSLTFTCQYNGNQLSFQYILIILYQIAQLMQQLSLKTSNQHIKNYLHDTSSTISNRFTRRQNQHLSNRKSHSRTSSEHSLSKINLSKFYVKIHTSQSGEERSPPRSNIINRIQQPLIPKKRSPTPQPGHKSKSTKLNSTKRIEHIETDLLIAQLQQKYGHQKSQKEILLKQIGTFQKQLNLAYSKIKQLQNLHLKSKEREEIALKKLEQYQSIVTITENSLHEARNNLEKLKNTIKQNKYAQMESDNVRLKNQVKALKNSLQSIQYQNNIQSTQICSLQNQIRVLASLNSNLAKQSRIEEKNREIEQLHKIIQQEKTQKEEKIQQCLISITQENQNLKLQIDKLQIRLNFLSRKKNSQIEMIRDSKNELISKLRRKISHIYSKYNSLCTQHDKLKAKNLFSSIKIERKNMMLQDITNDRTLFDLTPQK